MTIVLPKQIGTKEGKLLFQKAKKTEDFDKAKEIINSLKETLEYYGGVGLAAPQIGISERIFVVNIQPENGYSGIQKIGFKAYINPEILEVSSETNSDIEGCLSVFYGSLYGKVERPSMIKIKYLDINGEEKIEEIINSFYARVVLHENDHLDGKIFLQRMKSEDFSTLEWQENLDIRKKEK